MREVHAFIRSRLAPSALGLCRGTVFPMTRVRLSAKYQLVMPEDVRRELGFSPGQLFDVYALAGEARIVPVRPLDEAFGLLARCPGLVSSARRGGEEQP